MGILYQFLCLVSSGWMAVFPEYLIGAQGRKKGLFHNVVAKIEQGEDDKVSHVHIME